MYVCVFTACTRAVTYQTLITRALIADINICPSVYLANNATQRANALGCNAAETREPQTQSNRELPARNDGARVHVYVCMYVLADVG